MKVSLPVFGVGFFGLDLAFHQSLIVPLVIFSFLGGISKKKALLPSKVRELFWIICAIENNGQKMESDRFGSGCSALNCV